MDDGTAVEGGDILEGIDIIMGAAGPAMGDDEGQLAALQRTGNAIPGAIIAKGQIGFVGCDFAHGRLHLLAS